MEAKLIWSPASVEDLRSISDYIRRDSPRYADQVLEAIVDAAEELLEFPRMGWVVPETDDPSIRERVVYKYRLIYRIKPGSIEVVSVLHGARDLAPILKNRLT